MELTAAGDVDGDGYSDVLARPRDLLNVRTIASEGFMDVAGSVGGGTVQLYWGGPSGLSTTPGWEAPWAWGGGEKALGVGDVDGDGLLDLLLTGHRHAWLWNEFDFDRQVPPDPTEPEPPTDTSDTGVESSPTEPGTTAGTPTGTNLDGADPGGRCGCASADAASGLWIPWLLARHRW